jgi:hypothetical protein
MTPACLIDYVPVWEFLRFFGFGYNTKMKIALLGTNNYYPAKQPSGRSGCFSISMLYSSAVAKRRPTD